MAKRTFPDLGPDAAYARLRGNILDALQARTLCGTLCSRLACAARMPAACACVLARW